jgi:glutamyl-tRNA synthetase
MLALLGWNDSSGQELFTLDELVQKFSIERVHKGGAKFDYEKAKWFNHEWIKRLPVTRYREEVKELFERQNIPITDNAQFDKVLELVKDRCTLLPDFVTQASFFFQQPHSIDVAAIKPKWNEQKNLFFVELIRAYESMRMWEAEELEKVFKEIASVQSLKPGELMLPLRIMLVGGKFGPGVFEIAAIIGKEETVKRTKRTLLLLE